MRMMNVRSMAAVFAAVVAMIGAAQAATPDEIARQRAIDAQKQQRSQQPAARPNAGSAPPARQAAPPQQQARPPQPPAPQQRTRDPQGSREAAGSRVPDGRGPDYRERRGDFRGGGGRDYRDGDRGDRVRRGVAIGAGIAIIGGVLGYSAYRGPYRERVYDRCDRNFPDFDYDTGSFVNEDGDREICPYLLD